MTTKKRIIPGQFRVVSGGPYQKPVFPFEFRLRSPADPAAAALRKQYRLLDIAGEGSDFARARRLKSWVRSRWNHGWDKHDTKELETLDALDILPLAARGKSFQCWHYRRTLTQCCQAVGLAAREIGVCRKRVDFPDGIGANNAHAVTEVYCRELGKWVMLDADANAFYTVGGIPANTLDVHRAWHTDRGRTVKQVLDSPKFVVPTRSTVFSDKELPRVWREFVRYRTIDYYHHVFVNLINGFAAPPAKVGQKFIWYVGEMQPLLLMHYYGNDLDRFLFVEDPIHFNWPVNRTYLTAAMPPGKLSNQVEIRLEHTMPFFKDFEVSVGRQPFRRCSGNRLTLRCPPGRTTVRARCVDVFEKPGHEATLDLELRPASPALLKRRERERV